MDEVDRSRDSRSCNLGITERLKKSKACYSKSVQ